MSDKEFSTKINQLNKNGKLEDSKFPVLIDDEEFLFGIKNTHNSIKLTYNDEYHIQKKCKRKVFFEKNKKEFSDKRVMFNKYKDKFLKILNKKYRLNDLQIPLHLDLENIGLESCDGYKIFVDNNKYVIFGTDYYGLEDWLLLTGIKYKENEDEDDNMYDKMESTHTYGMKILMYYLSFEDYKVFKDKLNNEIELEKKRMKIEIKNKNKKLHNTDEL